MTKTYLVRDTEATPEQSYEASVKDFYAQDDDPGDVGAESIWKDTDASPAPLWWTRNAANDGLDASVQIRTAAVGDDEAYAQMLASTTGAGLADARAMATTEGAGNADARPTASSGGAALGAGLTGSANAGPVASSDDGSANVAGQATTSGEGSASAGSSATANGTGTALSLSDATAVSGKAQVSSIATSGAVAAGIYAEVEAGVAKLGFNAVATSGGITIPEIPATPTEQDIADVLVALGLATQAAP